MRIIKEETKYFDEQDVIDLQTAFYQSMDVAAREYFKPILEELGHTELGVALRDSKPYPVVVFVRGNKSCAVTVGNSNFTLRNTGEKFKDSRSLIDGIIKYLDSDVHVYA